MRTLFGPEGQRGTRESLVLFAVMLAAIAVFSGTLTHDFVWDDLHIIHYAHEIVQETGPAGMLTTPFIARPGDPSDTSGYYRPVSFVSMWINDPVGEASPFLFHLVNVVLHGVNAVLVFLLLRIIIPTGMGPLTGSLLFAVLPVHAESVAFVSGRTDLLAALFTLASAILWQSSRLGKGPRFSYAAGMVTFALACLAKEAAFVLPVVAATWILISWRGSEDRSGAGNNLDRWWVAGWFTVLAAVILVRFFVLGIGFGPGSSTIITGPAPGASAVFMSMVLEAGVNVATYLRLMIFPWPLAVYYPPVPMELTPLAVIASVGFVSLCFFLRGEKHHHVGPMALAWVIVFLGPVSGVVGLGLSTIAERFCYLPSVGVALVAGYSLELLRTRIKPRPLFTALFVILLAILSLGAVVHSQRWRDDVTLFGHAARSEMAAVSNIHFNLANALVEAGRPREAIVEYEKAIKLWPSYVGAMLNMASTHMTLEEHERAVEILSEAREFAPDDRRLWANMGVSLQILGRSEEALAAFNRALDLYPDDPSPAIHSGKLLMDLGRHEESMGAYQRALSIDPDHFGALVGLGRSLENLERLSEAEDTYVRAMESYPDQVDTYLGIGRVFLMQGRPRKAGAVYRAAVKVAPADPLAHKGVVIAAHQEGYREGAIAHIARLRETQPTLANEMTQLLNELDSKNRVNGEQ